MKKGLIDNFLGFVLAVIGLSVIFGGAWLVINKVFINQDSEIAKQTLTSIEGKISALEYGQTGTFAFRGPCKDPDVHGNCQKTWYLVGWEKDEVGRPERCFFKSCACICTGSPGDSASKGRFVQSCQESGICRFLDTGLQVYSYGPGYLRPDVPSVSDGDTSAVGDVQPQIYSQRATRKDFIAFPSNLIEIEINKTAKGIIIRSLDRRIGT